MDRETAPGPVNHIVIMTQDGCYLIHKNWYAPELWRRVRRAAAQAH